MIRKIGILTWHYYPNFGSQLQTYALVKTIRQLGFKCRVINYRNPKLGYPSLIKRIIKQCIALIPERFAVVCSQRFKLPEIRFRKYFNETSIAIDENKLNKLSKNFDALICGSDQIWAPNVFDPIYMLNFAVPGIRKISYAASIGLNDIPNHLVDFYRNNLKTFDSISVRESKGKQLLKDRCNIDSVVVLDPTLMIDVSQWQSIAIKPNITEDYIFCYFLNKEHKYARAIIDFASKTGLKVYAISANPKDSIWAKTLSYYEIGPKEFIGLIANANMVFTDSYHGTIFSLLFHKKFITFQRFSTGDPICQNSRIRQLNDYFSIGPNIVNPSCNDKPEPHEINWDQFEHKLSDLRNQSLNYLRKSLI